jgi:thiol-disulfide isomerase/thioredoxin
MRRFVLTGTFIVATLGIVSMASGQTTIVRDVRIAVGCTAWPCSPKEDFSGGEAILRSYRAVHGDTSEALEAMSWLARAAFAAGTFDRAQTYASDAHDLSRVALKTRSLERDLSLELALGAAIEVQAQVRAAQGRRSDAVYFLRRELETFRNTPIHMRISKNINLLSLEGEPAPALQAGEELGTPTPGFEQLKGKVVVLFFWAHWCGECKRQAPILSSLLDEHRSAGLVVVAPTQRYGYALKRAPATREAELAYIAQVRDEFYPFLRSGAVPVSEANHKLYGVSTTPTLVVLNRQGIVRLYHPGMMTADALEAVIKPLLGGNAK